MNSAAGSSTRARLCSFTKATTLVAAASELEKRKKFPTTTEFRLGPTLKYLKGLGVKIVSLLIKNPLKSLRWFNLSNPSLSKQW